MIPPSPRKSLPCRRCGTCCRLGGPVLHTEDLQLAARFDVGIREFAQGPAQTVTAAAIAELNRNGKGFGLADLLTLRRGELARDDVAGTLLPLDAECVKIAPSLLPATGPTDWTCRFLGFEDDIRSDHGSRPGKTRLATCRIHDHRPAQCRALSCTDTRAIALQYRKERVTRADLLAAADAPASWREVPAAHEANCSVLRMAELARHIPSRNIRGKQPDAGTAPESCDPNLPGSIDETDAANEILHILRFDASVRRLCTERGHIPPAFLPFLLGRPATALLEGFGLRLVRRDEKLCLVRIGPGYYPSRGAFPDHN